MVHVLDHNKRLAILAATYILPRPLRVAARVPLLERHQLGMAMRAQRFLLGHPKSGNTWLRTLLSRLYQNRYGLPDHLLLKSDEYAKEVREIPRFLVTNGYYSYEGIILRSIPELFRDRHILLLARNPCDIAVSWYIQFTKRVSAAKRELINATLRDPVDHRTISQWDFVMHPEIGLPGIIRYLNKSFEVVSSVEHSLICRYEDLRADTTKELTRIIAFFELDFSPAEIEAAVSFASFDNLRKLEKAGTFRRGGLRLRNHGDPTTLKVRRGKVAGYRDDFEPEKVQAMEELMERELDPGLGYTSAHA